MRWIPLSSAYTAYSYILTRTYTVDHNSLKGGTLLPIGSKNKPNLISTYLTCPNLSSLMGRGCPCARHNFSYTRGWMQMVFYCQMIYSPETNKCSKTRFMLWLLTAMDWHTTIHMIHTLCINVAWCCDEPVSCALRHFVTSNLLHCLMPTVCFCPAWRARPLNFPSFQDGPLFPRVHALLPLTVCYSP